MLCVYIVCVYVCVYRYNMVVIERDYQAIRKSVNFKVSFEV